MFLQTGKTAAKSKSMFWCDGKAQTPYEGFLPHNAPVPKKDTHFTQTEGNNRAEI